MCRQLFCGHTDLMLWIASLCFTGVPNPLWLCLYIRKTKNRLIKQILTGQLHFNMFCLFGFFVCLFFNETGRKEIVTLHHFPKCLHMGSYEVFRIRQCLSISRVLCHWFFQYLQIGTDKEVLYGVLKIFLKRNTDQKIYFK